MERNNYWNESSAAEQAEYLKWILPDLEGLDAQEVLKQQESAYEYYNFGQSGFEHGESVFEQPGFEHEESNFGQPGFEHGESNNYFNESGFVDYDIDEALARSLMMMDVNDDQFPPPSSPPNTRPNVTEPPQPVVVHVVETPEHDHDINPDTMTYEELQSLGDALGHESKGLSDRAISKLRKSSFKVKSSKKKEEEKDECTICCVEFKKGDKVITLPCKHFYHPECITKWLKINKNCPVCQREVPNS